MLNWCFFDVNFFLIPYIHRSKCYSVAPGKILDGNHIIHPQYVNYGPELNDYMNAERNCISFKPVHDGKGNYEPYLIGVATRDIFPGNEVGTTYGADHWKNQTHYKKLDSYEAQQECKAYYKFRLMDVKKIPKEKSSNSKFELSPTDSKTAKPSTSSGSRNSPRKNAATKKK